jgi:hypothetical protein
MTTFLKTRQSRCRAAVTRCDITPPVGIYHRMWGAATHNRASGVHKPLLATLLWLEPESGNSSAALVIVALDHCILDGPDIDAMQQSVAQSVNIRRERVLITLAHTHAAGLMSRSRSEQPGGELIGPYLDGVAAQLGKLAEEAAAALRPATIVYGQGRCSLAANRDFFDPASKQFVCGFNPDGPADDTLIVAKIVDIIDERIMATIVNYACHPTTLAWQNTLISPDYVGAMRETVEQHFGAPCLFLQGASADLGPRWGFVGNPAVADRNGRQLGFAALAALEALPPPHRDFAYAGPVISGATIGTWEYRPMVLGDRSALAGWHVEAWRTPLPYRPDLSTISQTEADLTQAQREEARATAAGQSDLARDYHARAERATRQLWRLRALPAGEFPLPVTFARLGDAVWLFIAGEHYQSLQTRLRERFPKTPIIVATLTNGWQPGYIPPADTYGSGIYQEQIAVVAAGSAERLLEEISQRMGALESDL